MTHEEFRDIVPELQPFVPPSLIDGGGWNRLLDRVGSLPGWATAAGAGFEFRLFGDAAADFAVAVVPGSPLLEFYVARGKDARPDSAAMSLGRFFAQVTGCPPSSWFEAAMLEYDVAGAAPGQAADPGLFVRLIHGEPGRSAKPLPPASVLAAMLARAVGWAEVEGEARAVERVAAVLPPGGEVGQIGAMPGRGLQAIRLIVDGVATEDVPDSLGRLGWPGEVGQVMAVLGEMGDVAPHFRLSLDISVGGLSPRLGLELYPLERNGRDHWLTTGRSAWQPIVERLEVLQWCQPDKARGLLDFPGFDKLFSERGVFILYRGVNHVKVSVEAGAVSAKAYAGLRFFRLDSASSE